MANNVYIGARYVPKFDGDYDATKVYEPLTIVMYNGSSYTSKRTVLAGILPTNTDYWANTGNLNGMITALQNAINNINNTISDYNKKLNYATGNITVKHYDENTYGVKIIKIPRTNQDGALSIPIIKGSSTCKKFVEWAEGTRAAVNAGYPAQSTDYQNLSWSMLVNDIVQTGTTDHHEHHVMAIAENGDLKEFFILASELSTLPAQGYHYACETRGAIILNGEMNSDFDTEFKESQVFFGYDNNHDYYIVTFSYHVPLTWAERAAWLISHIPDIIIMFALDGGGSYAAGVNGVKISGGNEFTRDGRSIAGVVCFPLEAHNDIESVGDTISSNQNINNPYVFPYETPIALSEHVSISALGISVIGQIVIMNGEVTVTPGNDVSAWQNVVLTGFPYSPASNIAVPLVPYDKNQEYTRARMRINSNNDQKSTNTSISILCEPTDENTTRHYNFQVTYISKQVI